MVDDDVDARLIYRSYLTVKGCHVYTARDGSIGVEIAKRRKPDLIVMDLAMPRLNGWAAAAELKQSPETIARPCCSTSCRTTTAAAPSSSPCSLTIPSRPARRTDAAVQLHVISVVKRRQTDRQPRRLREQSAGHREMG